MTATTAVRGPAPQEAAFRHDALFYDGAAGFVDGTLPFVRDGLRAGEPVMVVVGPDHIERLSAGLGADAAEVRFHDMSVVGRNPGRIIPLWREFVDAHAGSSVRGVGEPVWAGRTAEELVECERHEALINLAFGADVAMWLTCPYDLATLPESVLGEARRNHPYLLSGGGRRESDGFRGVEDIATPFDLPLPGRPADAAEMRFGSADDLRAVRAFVRHEAEAAGLTEDRVRDLILAVAEVAANSITHGGGNGTLGIWSDPRTVICEVRDAGRIGDPLAGRHRPALDAGSGFGLWLTHQLCDLVQVRSVPEGTITRLHMSRP